MTPDVKQRVYDAFASHARRRYSATAVIVLFADGTALGWTVAAVGGVVAGHQVWVRCEHTGRVWDTGAGCTPFRYDPATRAWIAGKSSFWNFGQGRWSTRDPRLVEPGKPPTEPTEAA